MSGTAWWVYNFVTKRGLCWRPQQDQLDAVETGSAIT